MRIVMAQMEPLNPFRTVVDLNGDWERYIHDKLLDIISVPSSLRPSGTYRLKRTFLLPRLSNGQRAVVHFDAITYYGRVFVNGHELGSMIPYLPHEFECTQQALEGRNTIEVEISDAHAEPDGAGGDEIRFGNCGGWECYGGIIRSVYVEVRAPAFINSVRFGYQLASDYKTVSCKAQVSVASAEAQSGTCDLTLFSGESEVAQATKAIQLQPGSNEIEVNFDLKAPSLWSPEEPNLYTLRAEMKTSSAQDRWSCRTGFREFKTQGRNFLLNGHPIVLTGVCRHDMWQDQGFTLSPRQQEQDMRMIKAMGANFVRLVHYPHDRKIVDLADELGLLISEEPGFWNMDFAKLPSSEIDLGCRILEGTIRRDWNSPAVVIWLLGNECAFPLSYLKRGKAICDQFDPIHRLVSVADLYGKFPEVKTVYDEAGLDFYDWHAYEFSSDKFMKLPESFGPDKPMTLTEWGWEDAGDGDIFYEQDFDGLLTQVEAGKIAGHSFWSWNDVPQFNRVDWPTHNGILRSGVVTENREIREPIYSRLAGLFAGRRENCGAPVPGRLILTPLRWVPFSPGSTFHSVDLQPSADSARGQQSWKELEDSLEKFWATNRMARDQWKRTGSQFALWQ
ncbi:MAG TPA: glycoside hydrolase family 2 TIM barrel-domain containing protein, partial [Acidobacteriaceae bacterium]